MSGAYVIHIHTDEENLIGDIHGFLLDDPALIAIAKRFDGIIFNVDDVGQQCDYEAVYLPIFEVVDEAQGPYKNGHLRYKLRGDKLDAAQLAKCCSDAVAAGRELVFVRTAWAM